MLRFHSHLQVHDHEHHVIMAYGLIWWRNVYTAIIEIDVLLLRVYRSGSSGNTSCWFSR